MFKRFISVMLAGASLLTMAGCQSSQTTAGDWDSVSKVYVAVSGAYENKIGKTGDDYYDNDYTRYIFDKTGVRLMPVILSSGGGSTTQQLAVKRAGGEQIDLITNWDLSQEYIQTELIVKLNDLLDEYESDNIKANIPESAWVGVKKLDDIWGLPSRSVLPNAPITYFFIRRDWMDKLGLDMPKSTDDLKEILRAFTEDDPDGNGVDDTYGMAHVGETTINALMLFFGVDCFREDIVDGNKLVSQAMTDRARQAFAEIRSWNKSGYLYQDSIANTKAANEMLCNNKVGVMLGTGTDAQNVTKVLKSNGYNDAKWELCTNQIVSSLDGKFYGWNRSNNYSSVTMVTSMAKDYPTIFKLLNWFYSEEGTLFQSYGLEGKEYVIKDGEIVPDVDYINNTSYIGMFNLGKSYNTYYEEQAERYYGDDELSKMYIKETLEHADRYYTERTDIKFQYTDLEEYTLYPDWLKGISNNRLKFVVGDSDPMDDATWQAYLEECESYGIQKLLDAAAKRHFQ